MAIRVGVIGCRGIGQVHASVYHADPLAELVCVCDRVEERADESARPWGARSYTSVEEMLSRERLDAVSVATGGVENGSHHYEPTMQCLEAGVHVLCEKPISNDVGEARRMVLKAREKGLYLGVNLNHRFVPPAERARAWIEEGRLGHLLLINMTLWIDNPNDSTPWFHMRALHPHSVDVMRFFCGDVRKVHAFMGSAPGRACLSNAQVSLLFENGVVGHLTGSYDAGMGHLVERCEVMGTEGRFLLENCFEELSFYPRRSAEVTRVRNSLMGGLTGFNDTFRTRIHRWLEQVSARVPPAEIEASGEDGLAAQEVIEAAIRSFQTESVVEVPRGV